MNKKPHTPQQIEAAKRFRELVDAFKGVALLRAQAAKLDNPRVMSILAMIRAAWEIARELQPGGERVFMNAVSQVSGAITQDLNAPPANDEQGT